MMKTNLYCCPRISRDQENAFHQSCGYIMLRLRRLILVMIGLNASLLQASEEISSANPKTHTLFMGADIDVQQSKNFYRVQNVSGGSFVIKLDGKDKNIPMRFNSVNMRVGYSLKLAETSINVGKFVVDRGYTVANDPNTKFVRSLSAGAADAQLSNDNAKLMALQLVASRAGNGAGVGGGAVGSVFMITGREFGDNPGSSPEAIQNQLNAVQRSYNASAGQLSSDQNSAGFGASKLAAELAEGMYDAIEITFEVSSDKPLTSPYALVLAQFSEQGAKPSEVQNWIYATELEPITREVRRVKFKQGGFPPGFELKSYQLHLYNHGQEVATTVAEKRVPLTFDEAFQYVMIEYLHANKGQTLSASMAMGRLPIELRNKVRAQKMFVKINKEGLPIGAFSDEVGSDKIDDPELEAALTNVRFKPALYQGKPIESISRLPQ